MCFRDVAGNTWKLSQLNQVPQLACGLTTTHELHYTKHFDPASGHSECMYVLDALIDVRDQCCISIHEASIRRRVRVGVQHLDWIYYLMDLCLFGCACTMDYRSISGPGAK